MILFINLIELFWKTTFSVLILILCFQIIRFLVFKKNKKTKSIWIAITSMAILFGFFISGYFQMCIKKSDYYYTSKMVSMHPIASNNFHLFEFSKDKILEDLEDILNQNFTRNQNNHGFDNDCYTRHTLNNLSGIIPKQNYTSLKKILSDKTVRSINICRDSTITFYFSRLHSPKDISVSNKTYYTDHILFFDSKKIFNNFKSYNKIELDTFINSNWRYLITKGEEYVW